MRLFTTYLSRLSAFAYDEQRLTCHPAEKARVGAFSGTKLALIGRSQGLLKSDR